MVKHENSTAQNKDVHSFQYINKYKAIMLFHFIGANMETLRTNKNEANVPDKLMHLVDTSCVPLSLLQNLIYMKRKKRKIFILMALLVKVLVSDIISVNLKKTLDS